VSAPLIAAANGRHQQWWAHNQELLQRERPKQEKSVLPQGRHRDRD
jgi:hypothetical protein